MAGCGDCGQRLAFQRRAANRTSGGSARQERTMKSNPIRYGLLLFLPILLALSFPIHSTKAGAEHAVSAPGPIALRALQAALPQQPTPSDQSAVIRVSTNLVAVPVSVTNAAG